MTLLPVFDASPGMPQSLLVSISAARRSTRPLQRSRNCGSLIYRKPFFSASCTLTPGSRQDNSKVFTYDYVEAQCCY